MFFFSCCLPYLLFATLLCMSGLTGSIGRHESALVRFPITQGHSTIFLCLLQTVVRDSFAISSTSFFIYGIACSFNNHLCTQLSLNKVMYSQHLSHWTNKANAQVLQTVLQVVLQAVLQATIASTKTTLQAVPQNISKYDSFNITFPLTGPADLHVDSNIKRSETWHRALTCLDALILRHSPPPSSFYKKRGAAQYCLRRPDIVHAITPTHSMRASAGAPTIKCLRHAAARRTAQGQTRR
jgi:hypothetical protein